MASSLMVEPLMVDHQCRHGGSSREPDAHPV